MAEAKETDKKPAPTEKEKAEEIISRETEKVKEIKKKEKAQQDLKGKADYPKKHLVMYDGAGDPLSVHLRPEMQSGSKRDQIDRQEEDQKKGADGGEVKASESCAMSKLISLTAMFMFTYLF